METVYVVTKQTTTNGTTTDVVKVTGKDREEAILNGKIKLYDTMKVFKNESTMVNAFCGISDLIDGLFIVSEYWEKETVTE